ncbi:permease prefix domain 1-containing protein [Aeromicrobium sp. UC242_57]|uniref:permease prefix domain 1-containing protein n=1 Tax=Aeromicrobium sp. UC242_57 TaxID=3374624 RepID=UPI0037AD4536
MTTLTERYVYATLRSVPEARRGDIGAELRGSIEDMIDARRDAGETAEAAERAVLTELGEPGRLASEYTGSSLYLIGPRYFLVWKKLNLNLLAWVPATVAVIVAVIKTLEDAALGDIIGGAISAAFTTGFQIAFWTTLVFAILERVDVEDGLQEWTVDELPELPGARSVSLGDSVGSSAFIILMMVALVGQHFRSWVDGPDGGDVPVLDPDLWSGWLPFLLAALVLSLVAEVWKYRVGHWTWPIASLVIVAGAAFALPVAWLADRGELLSPQFRDAVDVGNFETVVAWGAIAVLAWEIGEAIYMTWRGRSRAAAELTTEFESRNAVL